MTTDSNEHYLRQHEAQEEERERRFDAVSARRKNLVMSVIEGADKTDLIELVELVSNALYENAGVRTALKKIIKHGIYDGSEDEKGDLEALVNASVDFATLLFHRADALWGDALVEKAAEEADDDRPCRCKEDCKC